MTTDKKYSRITKLDEGKDYIWFSSQCDCNDTKHTNSIFIEYDKDLNRVVANLSSALRIDCDYPQYSKFKRLWIRLKLGLRFLWMGEMEMLEEFYFKDKEHIEDYITAITSGMKKMEKNIKKKGEKYEKRKV